MSKNNPMEISDFDFDTWLNDESTAPDWLSPGVETVYYEAFEELVQSVKNMIEESEEPQGLGVSNYQVQISDVTKKTGKSRSAIRRERFPRLLQYFDDTNAMLVYYRKSKVEAHATSKSYRNKPDLLDENRKLKDKIEKLEKLLHRKFLEQLISGTDNAYIQDKVAKISALEDRNRELEKQVARLSSQLRKTIRQID
jgi:hypothetical protein